MPRISAPTVEEHREAQRRALLQAAKDLILIAGLEALAFADLAERTGLARPTVHEYFRNKADLVRALIAEEFPRWPQAVKERVDAARTPEAAIDAFVRSQLALAVEGRHDLAFALMDHAVGSEIQADLHRRHLALLQEIAPALRAIGLPDERAQVLVSSVVAGMVQRVRHAGPSPQSIQAAVHFVQGGLSALRASSTPPD